MPRKGICLLVAFLMLFGPEHFHSLAQAEVQYANLSTASWAQGNRDIHYSYDDNGSLTEKITAIKDEPAPQTYFEEKVTNTYNLQNRLAQIVRQYDDANDTIEEFTEYTYNDNGIRVNKHTWSEINDTHQNDDVTVVYLVDSYNHTGYAQTLEELTFNKANPDPLTETPDSLTTYVIGDDVIAQTTDGTTQYLLYDGHGSTRQLAEYDSAVSIADTYSYDGYGVLLQDNAVASPNPGKVGTQATNLLYAGEYFDTDTQQYYLRARWYNPLSGLFNRIDPYSGNTQDPQSLHKYLYAHCNPINNIDPSGKFIGGITNLVNAVAIRVMFFGMRYGPTIAAGTFAVTKVTAAMLMATITHMALQELGVLPHNELVAEIGAILGYALIAELFIISMLPPSWISPPQAQGRGMNNTVVRKAVDTGIRVHYDKTTDPTRYSHRGCPTQLKKEIYHDTEFWFARRGQKGLDVKYLGGPHPSTYPGSKWPAGINRADFKPDTPTGRAFKLPPNTYRIFYDPQTGEIK